MGRARIRLRKLLCMSSRTKINEEVLKFSSKEYDQDTFSQKNDKDNSNQNPALTKQTHNHAISECLDLNDTISSDSFQDKLLAKIQQSKQSVGFMLCVLNCSVMSDSLQPQLQPTTLLCPWEFSRQEYWSGLPCPPPGDLPSPGIEPRSPTLQADSLLTEPWDCYLLLS